jgi:hypothetical protein
MTYVPLPFYGEYCDRQASDSLPDIHLEFSIRITMREALPGPTEKTLHEK